MQFSSQRVGTWYSVNGSTLQHYSMTVDDIVTDPAELRAAIDAGMQISVGPGEGPRAVTSLRFLEPVIHEIHHLRVGTVNRVVDAGILEEAGNLRSLEFAVGACPDRPDLSSLPYLEEFAGGITRATASVLRNPHLRYLSVEGAIPRSFARIAGPVEIFENEGGRSGVSLPVFEQPAAMRKLSRVGPATFSLAALSRMTNLERLRLVLCDDVTGLAALAGLPRLNFVDFNGVTTREDWGDMPMIEKGFLPEIHPYPSEAVLARWRAAGWILPFEPQLVEALVLDEAGDGESWGVFLSRFDDLADAVDRLDGSVAGGLEGEALIVLLFGVIQVLLGVVLVGNAFVSG